jgi:hypothetical protein
VLLLFQFVCRLSLGLAAAMTLVSPRLVTSGYYRNNLYVLLGLNVLAALVAWGHEGLGQFAFWPAALAAGVSYVGSVCWLYEKPRAGVAMLALVAACSAAAALGCTALQTSPGEAGTMWPGWLATLDVLSSSTLLGTTMAAMLLGHWYLNAPGMAISPLVRLIAIMGGAVLVRAAIGAATMGDDLRGGSEVSLGTAGLWGLRWLFGIVGTAVLAWMSWRTLKIPNTQSATGILYVAVIATFVGELASLLLSSGSSGGL